MINDKLKSEKLYKREAKIHGEEYASNRLLALQEDFQELSDEEFEFFEKIVAAERDRRDEKAIEDW